MRADAEGLHFHVWPHHLKDKLPLGFRHRFPGPAHAEGLLLRRHLGGKSGHHGGTFELVGDLHDRRPHIARRHHYQRDGFAEAFRDRYRFGEQGLLEVAEYLFHGEVVFGAARASKPAREHHHVVLDGIHAIQRPAQLIERVVIAHRHQRVARADADGIARNGFLMLELEMLLHLLFRVSKLPLRYPLGDGKQKEERDGEGYARFGRG